jgi:hypothetical protein
MSVRKTACKSLRLFFDAYKLFQTYLLEGLVERIAASADLDLASLFLEPFLEEKNFAYAGRVDCVYVREVECHDRALLPGCVFETLLEENRRLHAHESSVNLEQDLILGNWLYIALQHFQILLSL